MNFTPILRNVLFSIHSHNSLYCFVLLGQICCWLYNSQIQCFANQWDNRLEKNKYQKAPPTPNSIREQYENTPNYLCFMLYLALFLARRTTKTKQSKRLQGKQAQTTLKILDLERNNLFSMWTELTSIFTFHMIFKNTAVCLLLINSIWWETLHVSEKKKKKICYAGSRFYEYITASEWYKGSRLTVTF